MSNILNTPMNIGSCEIKNRVVMAPMLMGFGQFDGKPTKKMMDYYEERAKGGTGLIITEITRVNDQTGAGAFAQLAVSHDYHIKPLSELAERIHRHGAKLFVQLHHPGRQNVGLLVGTVPLSIKCENLTRGAGRVRALRHSEIKQLEQQFIDGAVRVKKAGCDGVELHSSHGYLLQQFLSPVTNQRTDEYGGSLENRMRFILNIIKGIKAACGEDFPLIVRLTVDECYERIGQPGKGYTLEEGVEIARHLEKAGIDAIDVSSAGYDTFNYWLEPVSFEPGWRKYMAKAVKDAVSIPVIAANLIRSPEQAEQQLEDGTQDFISLGRPHIADPHWTEKAIDGKTIRRCICCLNCIESMEENAFIGSHGECSVNPFVGHEGEELIKDGNGRAAVVIGAGPAGLMVADVLAQRGFKVTVFEKNAVPGGQINLASAPPEKSKTAWMIEDLAKICREEGVEIRLNTPATADAIIAATGSRPIKPRFAGNCPAEEILTFEDILSGKAELKDCSVAVIGSGLTGLETAHALCENGCKVTIVEMANEVAPGTWMQHKDDILPKLKSAGAKIKTGEKLCEVYIDRIVTENVKTKQRTDIPCDRVVLSLGSRPDASVVEELKRSGFPPIVIGDANRAGKIADATKAAYKAAISIK